MRARFWQFVSAAAFTCLVAPPALAHAVLINSVPSASQQLETAPQQIELRFNENVGAVFFKVLNRAGIQVGAPGEVRADGNNVVLPLGATLPKGTYVVTYRVISGDTHPVAGSYAFSIGEPLASAAAAMPEASRIWAVPAAISRAMLYASALLVMGSALLLVVMPWPQRLRALLQRQGQLAARWAALALVAALGLGGADMVAAVPAALLSAQPWSAGVRSTLGLSTLLGMSGAMLAITAFRSAQKYLLLCSCGLLVVSFMVTGHAATAVPVWLAATSVGLHLAAAGFWVAALLPLLAYAGLVAPREAGRAMQQFSSHALWFVALLFASGSVISWIQV